MRSRPLWLTILGAFVALSSTLPAQQAPHPPPSRPGLPLHRSLVDLDLAEKGNATPETIERVARGPKVKRREDGAVRVEIIGPAGATMSSLSTDPRIEGLTKFSNVGEAWIQMDDLASVAATLPEGHVILPAGMLSGEDLIEGQGPDVTRSGLYRDDGFDGSGLTIAVIDGSWSGFYNSLNAGEIPPLGQLSIFNLSGSTFTSGDSKHGTACLETVYDHAPGANYLAYKASGSTLGQAVESAILLGADIISHSMSRYNLGWNDDEGAACDAANMAAAAGVLFFTSAGNRAETHFQGDFETSDADEWHEWSNNGDETINVTIPAESTARIYLSWDTSGGTHDYDLYLYNSDATVIIASSDSVGEGYEALSFENAGFQGIDAHISVLRRSGDGTELELFQHGGGVWDEHAVALGSTTSPSNSTHPNVISVGAVEWQDYGEGPGTFNLLTNYSSIGPSNSFMTVPDVAGPTKTSGFAFGAFSGTSCSTPNAAGAAAVLWSCNPALPASTVRNELFDFANIRDWAWDGKDILYGEGGLILPYLIDCNSDGDPDACDILNGAVDNNDNGKIDSCEAAGFNIGFQIPNTPVDPLASIGFIPVTVLASEVLDPTGTPTPVNGFNLNFQTSLPNAVIASVIPSPEIQALNFGNGPSFFTVIPSGNSVLVETIFDSAALSTLTLEQETPLIQFEIQVLMSTYNQAESVDLNDLGLNWIVTVDAAGTATPSSVGGLAIPEPMDRFQMEVVDLVRHYDPADASEIAVVRPELRQVDGVLDPAEGFTFFINNDPAVIQATNVTTLGMLNDLNGGAGPDYFEFEIGTDYVGAASIFNFMALDSIPLTSAGRPIAITYLTQPGNLQGDLVGFTTPLLWDEMAAHTISTSTGVNDASLLNGWITFIPEIDEVFIRGDFDGSGTSLINDAVQLLSYLFSGGAAPACPDAADVNDDGTLGIADPIWLLAYLFSGGDSPPAPGAEFCGVDPTPDTLGPCIQGNCPAPPDQGGLDD